MYDVRKLERSGGVYVNCPLAALNVSDGLPAAAVVTLDRGGTTGLFKIAETPLLEFQSAFTCAEGIVGLFVKSV